MESRASYLLIGGFVLLVIAASFGFLVWLAKVEINREVVYYDVYFEGSVTGLGEGGDVRYRGIRVGTVTDLGIDPNDPGRVRVTVQLGIDTPIREGDEASLQLQGITGVSFVNIEGAGPQSPLLSVADGEPRAVIPSRKSAIEKLFSGAPDVIAHTLVLMAKFSELLNEENQRAIGGILADTKILTGTFASRQQQFARILDSVDEFSGELKTITNSANTAAVRIDQLADEASVTLREFRTMAAGVDQVVQEDIQNLVAELRVTTEKLQSLASNANGVLQENREPLNSFIGDGLKQFTSFITDASILVSRMTRLTERLETEGAGFLLDNNQSEFQVEN